MGRACRLLLALVVATLALPAIAQDKRVASSFDDVPRKAGAFFTPDERAEKLCAVLREAGVEQAAFFVTPGLLGDPDGAGGEARIAAYVADGHVIANHSFAHSHLRHSTAEEYLADIDQAASWLAGRAGFRPWFRFPYLDEGGRDTAKRDAVRAGIAARGLRNGYVTADGSDWHLEQLTLDAQGSGKAMDMQRLRHLYIASQTSGLEYHDAWHG
ncbi:MAG: polysaccharide deacetylase family protein [Parerythrobacter sp.]